MLICVKLWNTWGNVERLYCGAILETSFLTIWNACMWENMEHLYVGHTERLYVEQYRMLISEQCGTLIGMIIWYMHSDRNSMM